LERTIKKPFSGLKTEVYGYSIWPKNHTWVLNRFVKVFCRFDGCTKGEVSLLPYR